MYKVAEASQLCIRRKVADTPVMNLVNLKSDEWPDNLHCKQSCCRKGKQDEFGNDSEAGVFLKFGWEFGL